MNYVDGYTSGSDWASDRGDAGSAFEARIRKNENNSRLARLNEDGRARFNGHTTFEEMRDVGYRVQDRIAYEIRARSGTELNPAYIPDAVDQEIVNRIREA